MSVQSVTTAGGATRGVLHQAGRQPELALELIRKTVATMDTGQAQGHATGGGTRGATRAGGAARIDTYA